MKRAAPMRRSSLRRVSPGRARQNRAYSVLRAEFLEAHPACERCGQAADQVHHRRGRGALFLAVELWMAACGECHQWITEHPAEAFALGFSERRIGAA